MSDEVQGGVDTPNGEPEAQTTDTPTVEELQVQLKAAQDKIAEVNREAKKRRLDKEKADADAELDRQKGMKEKEQFKELSEQLEKELNTLRPQAAEVQRYREAFLATLEKRLQALPDNWKTAVPDFGDPVKSMEWLDANQHLFTTRQAPNIDAGAGNNPTPKGTPKLTSEQIAFARQYGMTDEEYLKYLRVEGRANPDK